MRKTIVGVFGDSEAEKREKKFAKQIGREIGTRGYVLLTGARGGIMLSACKGAKEEGGLTLGILPSSDKSRANRFTEIVIPTGLGSTRNSLNALTSDYVIVIGGKSGTLSEIAFSWLYGNPILAVKGFGGWSEKLAGKRIDQRRKDHIIPIESPKQALDWIDEREKKSYK